jgi:lysophospholipase L1-like esterase
MLCQGACNDGSPTSPSPSTPPPPAANEPVRYTAIGASDALGVGGSRPCLPLTPCEEGSGYVPLIRNSLAQTRTVTLTNLGVPGAVLGPDTQALARRYGRDVVANFLDNEVPFVPRDSTIVTVFAGGNDVNAIAAAAAGGAASAGIATFVEQQVRQFATDMSRLVGAVRDRAPSARIVVANLPNLSYAPYAAGYGSDGRQLLHLLSVGISTQAINPLASQGVLVVDLLCDERTYDPSRYSGDGFHPNDRGYQLIAESMLAAITSVSVAPPASTCLAMNPR